MIARSDGRYRSAYRLHHSRTFVAQNDWQRRWKELIANDHIGVANTCSHDTHADLVGTWNSQLCALDLELATGFTQHGDFYFDG
jgi:hypothetical protein